MHGNITGGRVDGKTYTNEASQIRPMGMYKSAEGAVVFGNSIFRDNPLQSETPAKLRYNNELSRTTSKVKSLGNSKVERSSYSGGLLL